MLHQIRGMVCFGMELMYAGGHNVSRIFQNFLPLMDKD